MTVIASDPIHLGTPPAAWNREALQQDAVRSNNAPVTRTPVPLRARVGIIGRDDDIDVSFPKWSRTTLMDGAMLLGVVWSIPIAVLVVGTPVALTIAFLLWLVRLARGAF